MELKGVKKIELQSGPGLGAAAHGNAKHVAHPNHTVVIMFDNGRSVTIHPSYMDVVELLRASS